MHPLPTSSPPSPSRRQIFKALGLLGLPLGLAGVARAQSWPDRPLRFIVPYTAGGGVDKIARVIGDRLAVALGQPVVIDNRGGAAGNIGTEAGVRAEPNGYTIVMGAAALAINQTLYRKLPFDATRDLLPVSLIAKTPNILAVHPQVPATSVAELIQLARNKPGALNYASAGSGTTPHLAAELFGSMAGVQMTHVPYKGSAPAVTALLSGEVDLMLAPALTVLPYIKAGKLRGLATTGAERSAAFPELPTLAESGLPGFEASQWYGVLVPAGTPRPVIDRLQQALVRIVHQPDVVAALSSDGSEPVGSTPEAFAAYFQTEVARWRKVIPASERLN